MYIKIYIKIYVDLQVVLTKIISTPNLSLFKSTCCQVMGGGGFQEILHDRNGIQVCLIVWLMM